MCFQFLFRNSFNEGRTAMVVGAKDEESAKVAFFKQHPKATKVKVKLIEVEIIYG